MDVKPYRRKYPDVAKLLYKEKILSKYPHQVERIDLEYAEGVDIVYTLKNLSPARFSEVVDYLLLAAVTEANRYEEYRWKFAKFQVELSRTAKGKKKVGLVRDYVAAKHDDPDIMVYGEEALGYTIPEGDRKPFLINKAKEILDIPNSSSPGAYVTKQSPYKVVTMVVSIRTDPI